MGLDANFGSRTHLIFLGGGPWRCGPSTGSCGRVRPDLLCPPNPAPRGLRALSGWLASVCAQPLRWSRPKSSVPTGAWVPCRVTGVACGHTPGARLAPDPLRLSALSAMPRKRSVTPVSVKGSPGAAPEQPMKRKRRLRKRSSRSPAPTTRPGVPLRQILTAEGEIDPAELTRRATAHGRGGDGSHGAGSGGPRP